MQSHDVDMEKLAKKLTLSSYESLAKGILKEMEKTSSPDLAFKLAKDSLSHGEATYDEPPTTKYSGVEKWEAICEKMASKLSEEEINSVVLELSASKDFPTEEDWERREAFLLDAPNELTEVVEHGGFPADEPRPHDGWDYGDEDSFEPRMPDTETFPKR